MLFSSRTSASLLHCCAARHTRRPAKGVRVLTHGGRHGIQCPPRASGRAPEHAPPPHGAPHPARAGAALRHPGDAALARGRGRGAPLRSRHFPRKLGEGVVFRALAAYAAPRLRAAGIATADRVYGMHQTGHIDERYLLALMAALPPGLSEVYWCTAIRRRAWRPRWRRTSEGTTTWASWRRSPARGCGRRCGRGGGARLSSAVGAAVVLRASG